MRRTPVRAWALLVLLTAGCRIERRAPVVPADLVLRHGAVYTVWPSRPWVEALAIRDGRLVFVGDEAGVDKFIGRATRVIDLAGRMVLPGFQDSHSHPLSGGLELGECNLYLARTAAEIEGAIRAYGQDHPNLPWIRGNGWQLPVFYNANPSRQLLDVLVPDRPAFFYAADGHSAWVNSKAIELAGLTRDTPDPPNGRIERDGAGNPSGTLRESAIDLVSKLLPEYSTQDRIGAARRALAEANRFGITSITDADAGPSYLEAYRALDDRGQLTARVYVALHSEDNPIAGETIRLVELRKRYAGSRLSANSVKFYADGVIEARTAALLEPYTGRGKESGSLNYSPEDLTSRIAAVDREGFQVHVHAIGDRAIRVSLDALAQARHENGPRDARPILAHIELIDPADISRFRSGGVIASFQPFWAQADEYIRDLTLPVLGPVRSRWLYPIASVLNSGAVVVGGSDWTVSTLNPLDAIQVAVTRRSLEEPNGTPWIAEERADLPRMIAAYTINAAYANRMERETGSLEPGKLADVVVLDKNLFDLPVTELHSAKVLLTLLDGREVWRDSSFVVP
jgi:predicted amidohydrolase YtcJ